MTVCLTSYVKTNNNGQGYFYHKSYYILSRAVVHVLVVLVYGISICLIIPFAFLRPPRLPRGHSRSVYFGEETGKNGWQTAQTRSEQVTQKLYKMAKGGADYRD